MPRMSAPSPNPPPAPQPPAATPAPDATKASLCSSGKGALSPDAPPFFPDGAQGRSKTMRWVEISDYSDSDTDSVQSAGKPSYLDAVLRGTPVLVDPDLAGDGTQPPTQTVEMPPAEEVAEGRKSARKRRWRRMKPRAVDPTAAEPAAAPRAPVHQCLGPQVSSGRRQEGGRVSVHQRLGPQAPPRWRRRISAPDAEGWREVLPRQLAEPRPSPPPHNPPRRRRIPEAVRDRCLICLSYNHRLATCRAPLRCLRCHGLRHLARDCKRGRSPGVGSGATGPLNRRFIRATGGGRNDKPPASQAGDSTPPNSPPASNDLGNDFDFNGRDPLPMGHPDDMSMQRQACVFPSRPWWPTVPRPSLR